MALNEDEIRKITLHAIQELGEKATPELVKKIVSNAIEHYTPTLDKSERINKDSGRVILTSFGMNYPGIIASVTQVLSAAGCDIRDLSQKLMDEFYTMIMIIDISKSTKDLNELQTELHHVAERLKIKIYLQHEDLFRYMHRV